MSCEDKELCLADRFLIKTGQGKVPDMITQDLRFDLEAGKKRLERNGPVEEPRDISCGDRGPQGQGRLYSKLPRLRNPFCGTLFSVSGLYSRISSCCFAEDVIWRHGFDERQKKRHAVRCPYCGASFNEARGRNCPY